MEDRAGGAPGDLGLENLLTRLPGWRTNLNEIEMKK